MKRREIKISADKVVFINGVLYERATGKDLLLDNDSVKEHVWDEFLVNLVSRGIIKNPSQLTGRPEDSYRSLIDAMIDVINYCYILQKKM